MHKQVNLRMINLGQTLKSFGADGESPWTIWFWCWRMSVASWPCPFWMLTWSGCSVPCPPFPILSNRTEFEGLLTFHCKEVGKLWPVSWGCPPKRSFQMNRLCRFLVQFTEEFLISVLLYTHLHNYLLVLRISELLTSNLKSGFS